MLLTAVFYKPFRASSVLLLGKKYQGAINPCYRVIHFVAMAAKINKAVQTLFLDAVENLDNSIIIMKKMNLTRSDTIELVTAFD